ncbi:MAG: tape measure protein, partial [Magnetococcales bacterium]|nr:tape measure protein [Magnetococcales bacterium]
MEKRIEIVLGLGARAFKEGLTQSRRLFGESMADMAQTATTRARRIAQALSQIDDFKGVQSSIVETQRLWQAAATEAERLGASYQKALSLGNDPQTLEFQRQLKRDYDAALRSANGLRQELDQQKEALTNLSGHLAQAGINTSRLEEGQLRLRWSLEKANREAQGQSRVMQAFAVIGVRASRDVEIEIKRLQHAYKQLAESGRVTATDLDRAHRQMQQQVAALRSELNGVARESRTLGAGLFALQGALAAAGVGALGQSIFNAATSMDAIRNALKSVTGSSEEAAREFKFVRDEADRLGLGLEATAKGYVQLAASAKGTTLEGSRARSIFSAVAEASAALSLSADDTSGVLLALGQMISKGTVSAEELRGQLGERLPGAFQIAARAMGVSTAQLSEMLEQGKIATEEFLPKFAAEVRKTYAQGLPEATNTARAALNRLNAQWIVARDAFAASGFMDGVVTGIKALTAALSDPANKAAMSAISSGIGSIIGLVFDYADAIKSLVAGYAAYRATLLLTAGVQSIMAGSFAGSIARFIALLTPMGHIAIALGGIASAYVYLSSSTDDVSDSTANLAQKLAEISVQLGIDIPNMATFNRLLREGAITADEAAGRWVLSSRIVAEAILAQGGAAKEVTQQIRELTAQREASVAKLADLERKLADEEKILQKEVLQEKLQTAQQAVTATQQKVQESLEAERRLAEEVRSLEEGKRNAQQTTADRIRALLERDMSDREQDLSRASAAYAQLQEARRLLAQEKLSDDDAKWAIQLATKAQDAYASLNDTNSAIKGVKEAGATLEQLYEK